MTLPPNGSLMFSRLTAADDAVAQGLDDLARLDDGPDVDAVHGAAVVLGDDHVLADVHQAPRQVAGVRRLERGVGEALAGAVGRDEVLQHGEAFAEVRGDRVLDDLAGRARHQAAHAGQLADLLLGAAGARVGHDVDRVELVRLPCPGFSISLNIASATFSVTVDQMAMTLL